MDLTGVYRIFHPTTVQYTFFAAAHSTFSKINHILWHKTSLSKYKKSEIIPSILSDHSVLKLELNNKNNSRKYPNNWRLNNTLLNDQWGHGKNERKSKGSWKLKKMKMPPPRTYGIQQRQS
jgi:hypothetical protein